MTQRASRVTVVWSRHPSPDTAERLIRRTTIARLAGPGAVPESAVRLLRLCPSCGSDQHGRPTLAPSDRFDLPHVSISRAGGLTVVAVSQAGPVGVDVETETAADLGGYLGTAITPGEASPRGDRTVTWVRTEALLKATGQGLTVDPSSIRLTEPSAPPALVEWADGSPGPVWMSDLHLATGYVAALAVLTPEPPGLVVSEEQEAAEAPR